MKRLRLNRPIPTNQNKDIRNNLQLFSPPRLDREEEQLFYHETTDPIIFSMSNVIFTCYGPLETNVVHGIVGLLPYPLIDIIVVLGVATGVVVVGRGGGVVLGVDLQSH